MRQRASMFAVATLLFIVTAGTPPALAGAGPGNQIKSFMVNTGVEPGDRGRILFVGNKSQSVLSIKLHGMDPNSAYDVEVDGVSQESILTDGSGQGHVTHKTRTNGVVTPLPYDPRGHTLTISDQGDVVLTSDFPATPKEGHALVRIRFNLAASTGVAGSAEARFRSRFGRMAFDVEVRGALPGAYDLLVDGTKVGTIDVNAGGRGSIHFDTIPESDPNEASHMDLLMTFDPRGKAIAIQLSAVDVFSGTLPLI